MIAVITATKGEARAAGAAMKPYKGLLEEGRAYGMRLAHGAIARRRVVLIEAGVGKVNAATAAFYATAVLQADAVRNIGLAGGLESRMEVGEAYTASSAVQYDFDLSKVDNKCIGTLNEKKSPYLDVKPLPHFMQRRIGTADRFGSGEDPVLNAHRCQIRDMECAAMVQVCEKTGVPFYVLKIISDVVGKEAETGEQYARNAKRALAILTEMVVEAVDEVDRIMKK